MADVEAQGERPERISGCTLTFHWFWTFGHLAYVSFLIYAAATTPGDQQESELWKLLLCYSVFAAYSNLVSLMQCMSKTVYYARHGPGNVPVTDLPLHAFIANIGACVQPASWGLVITSFWIMGVLFPWKDCGMIQYEMACLALHINSIVAFSGLMVLTLICCFLPCILLCTYRNNSSGNLHGLADEGANYIPIPDAVRRRMVDALPLTRSPSTTDDCAICQTFDDGSEWRVLPCGHKFHKDCVDGWLLERGRSCPVCRQDPVDPTTQRLFDGREESDQPPPVGDGAGDGASASRVPDDFV